MAGIIFFFEETSRDVFSGRPQDLDAWNYAIKIAGDIDNMVIINRTNQRIRRVDSDLKNFHVLDTLPDFDLWGRVVHVVCPWDATGNKTTLWGFDHAVDWYVFGPASGWGSLQSECAVFIPQAGKGALHALHVAPIIMAHRFYKIKGGQ